MKKRKIIFIVTMIILLSHLGVWQIEAATTICPRCGGRGYTSFTLFVTQTIGFNPVTGMAQTIQMPKEQRIPCGSCGGSGRIYSPSTSTSASSSSKSNSSSSSSSSSNTAIGKKVRNGFVIDATDGIGDYEDGHNLLDGNKKTKFNVKATKAFIIWEAPKKIRVSGYVITTANDTATYTGRNPKSWVLYGSNKKLARNAKGWKKIHSVKNDKKLKPTNYKSYKYKLKKKAKAYRYYKLEITANQGADCTQLSEFKIKSK